MPGLTAVDHLIDGTRVEADVELRHWQRELMAIDPDMRVCVDFSTGMFDVWTLDAHGEPFIALSRPYCDGRLVRDVQAVDTRYRDVAGEAKAQNERVEATAEADFEARTEEAHEKLLFGLRRDIGAYEGGITRSFTYFPSGAT